MRAYEYLIKYAKVYTTSDEESDTHPSSMRQLELAKILTKDLKTIGCSDVVMDENGYVYAKLPASPLCEDKPALGLIAHMDTTPDAPGENVKPLVHENYDGKALPLPGGIILDPARFPFLKKLAGETLITSDGRTLLGADDKAGISEIMAAAETIIQENRSHGKICIGFTPDEEIGRGADLFDIKKFGADFAYTVDGGDVGEIEYENFNAASAQVKVRGLSVHPGSAKDTMINASKVAMEFHGDLPATECPEHTSGREGFYHLMRMEGDVSAAKLIYILRDHDMDKLEYKKETMRHIADCLNGEYGKDTVEVKIKDDYRNMIEKIKPHFHLIETARKAIRELGITPAEEAVRGGTDGANLSFKGLPCPNLGTGGFNFHGVYECISAERMEKAVQVILRIIDLYAK